MYIYIYIYICIYIYIYRERERERTPHLVSRGASRITIPLESGIHFSNYLEVYTLHPTPYTPHPKPYTLHPKHQTQRLTPNPYLPPLHPPRERIFLRVEGTGVPRS